MEEELEVELTEDTVLELPKNLSYYQVGNSLLIISRDAANWIVLFNEEQKKYLI